MDADNIPKLKLSGLGGRRRRPVKRECLHSMAIKQSPSIAFGGRKRPRDRYDVPPIPSSFVDGCTAKNKDVLAKLEEDFFKEEMKDEKTNGTSKKERVRYKLQQYQNLLETTTVLSAEDDTDDTVLFQPTIFDKKSNIISKTSINNNVSATKCQCAAPNLKQQSITCKTPETIPINPISNDLEQNDRINEANEVTKTKIFRDTIRTCYTSMDFAKATIGDVVKAVAKEMGWSPPTMQQMRSKVKDEVTVLVKEQQQQQPEEAVLYAVVDELFTSTIQSTETLQNCSVNDFFAATQARFPNMTITRKTKKIIKDRVMDLFQQRLQPSNGLILAHQVVDPATLCTATRSKEKDQPLRKENEVPPLMETEILHSSASQENSSSGTVIDKAASTILPNNKDGPSKKQNNFVEDAVKEKKALTRVTRSRNQPKISERDCTEIGASGGPDLFVEKDDRRRKQSRVTSCSLCSKCPCKMRTNDLSCTMLSTMDSAHIERALMKRLLKLEEITDQYDEQTEAVRRRLKKHRRDIWKKREDLLRRCSENEVRGKNSTSAASASWFLPDADEFNHQLKNEHRLKKRRNKKEVNTAKAALFEKSERQPTLTQMLVETEFEKTANGIEDCGEAAVNVNFLEADDTQAFDHAIEQESEDTRCNMSDYELIEKEDTLFQPSPPFKTHRIENGLIQNSDDVVGCTSIWDAFRNGNFHSSWDRLFYEDSDGIGVDHLIELLPSSPHIECEATQESRGVSTPSSLSTRGKAMADSIVEQMYKGNRAAIERVCPNWKENVNFIMGQTNGAAVSEALQNVRDARMKLTKVKLSILQNIELQEATLSFFEDIMNQSLLRIETPQETPDSNIQVTQRTYNNDPTEGVSLSCTGSGALTILATPMQSEHVLSGDFGLLSNSGKCNINLRSSVPDTPLTMTPTT